MTNFTNNQERMRYAAFRPAGYMRGSGTIESGRKQIVPQRLKLPGTQWEVAGAVKTAKARAAWPRHLAALVHTTFSLASCSLTTFAYTHSVSKRLFIPLLTFPFAMLQF